MGGRVGVVGYGRVKHREWGDGVCGWGGGEGGWNPSERKCPTSLPPGKVVSDCKPAVFLKEGGGGG